MKLFCFHFLIIFHLGCFKANQTSYNIIPKPESTQTQVSHISVDSFKLENGKILVKIEKSDEEWRNGLNDQEYYVLRQKGTERAFSTVMHENKEKGLYCCKGCGLPLYRSEAKFNSGTGWPSYTEPIKDEVLTMDTDNKIGYARTEILCARCGGHLGHVFNDGPPPTGMRHCVNSVSLQFVPEEQVQDFLEKL